MLVLMDLVLMDFHLLDKILKKCEMAKYYHSLKERPNVVNCKNYSVTKLANFV